MEIDRKHRVFVIDNHSGSVLYNKTWERLSAELDELDGVLRSRIIIGSKMNDPKFSQFHDLAAISNDLLMSLKRFAKKDSIFIFANARDPIAFMLRQHSQIYDLNFTLIGFWLDGTHDQYGELRSYFRGKDYRWSNKLERALFDCFDYNLVPRESQVYHATKSLNAATAKKVMQCPLPFSQTVSDIKSFLDNLGDVDKDDMVILNAYPNSYHNKELFDSMEHMFPNYIFMTTYQQPVDRNSYFRLLSRAKVVISTNQADVNTFSIFEAMMFGCIPILPDIDSYSEIFSDKWLYSSKILKPPYLNFIRGSHQIYDKVNYYIENYDEIDMSDEIDDIYKKFYSSDKLKEIILSLINN